MPRYFNSKPTFFTKVAKLAPLLALSACTLSKSSDADVLQNIPKVKAAHTLTLGQEGFETSSDEDSKTFQRAIDRLSQKGGGNLIVPAGSYRIKNVHLKTGVHILFQPDVTLVPGKGKGANLFNCGNNGETISNVAIMGQTDRFTFDFTDATVSSEVSKLRAIGVGDCDGFTFKNFDINDNFTVFSSLIFGWDGHVNSRAKHGRNGTVENITAKNAHYGYGAIQAHSGENITFRNIKSIGGVAVRLETGLIPMNIAQIGGLDKILVEGAYSQNGQAALMFQPHTMQHGSIIARDIISDGSEFAVSIAAPFVSKRRYTEADNLKPGNYKSLEIDDIKSTYRDGPIITRFTHLKYYPKALHPMITRAEGAISQPEFRGPSIAAVSLQDTLSDNIKVTNIEAIGFKYHPDTITKENVFTGNLRQLGRRDPQRRALKKRLPKKAKRTSE